MLSYSVIFGAVIFIAGFYTVCGGKEMVMKYFLLLHPLFLSTSRGLGKYSKEINSLIGILSAVIIF